MLIDFMLVTVLPHRHRMLVLAQGYHSSRDHFGCSRQVEFDDTEHYSCYSYKMLCCFDNNIYLFFWHTGADKQISLPNVSCCITEEVIRLYVLCSVWGNCVETVKGRLRPQTWMASTRGVHRRLPGLPSPNSCLMSRYKWTIVVGFNTQQPGTQPHMVLFAGDRL